MGLPALAGGFFTTEPPWKTKSNYINNIKYEWIKPSNQNVNIYRLNKNQDSFISCQHKTHIRFKDISRLKVDGWKKYHTNNNHKKAGKAILMSDKTD